MKQLLALALLLTLTAQAVELHWYQDLEKAKLEAKERHLPILSLRLLGKLDEELSCANSRFFRTVLYANAEVAKYLSENFVLHWESVRPVPKVTIDFGDGRKILTTVTGNSIHYVLDEEGHPLDALPGLLSPRRFLDDLRRAKEGPAKRLAELRKEWRAAHRRFGLRMKRSLPIVPEQIRLSARAANVIAITKAVSQAPLVQEITPREAKSAEAELREEPIWEKISDSLVKDVDLDEGSLAIIRKQLPHRDLTGLIGKLKRSIAQDTAWNEYFFHPRILAWLAKGPQSLKDLNERVYRELFLSPTDDPWMGLVSEDTYNGLPDNGLQAAK